MAQAISEIRQMLSAGQLAEAESACRALLSETPENADVLQLLSEIFCATGAWSEAVTTLEKVVVLRPNDSHTLNNLAVALRHVGKLDEAIVILQQALLRRPDLALPYKNLGEIYRQRQQLPLAKAQYETALRCDPNDPEIYNGLGIVLAMQGRRIAAVSPLEKAIELNPKYAEAENNLANILLSLGRFDEAFSHARQAVHLLPDRANLRITLGNTLKAHGDNEGAVSEYQRALQINPHNALIHQSLGTTLTDLGRFDEAIGHLEEALQRNPRLYVVYQNLAALAVQNQYHFSDAQRDRLQELSESDTLFAADASCIQFTLGTLLNQQGDYDAAMKSYQCANALQWEILKSANRAFDANGFEKQVDDTIEVFSEAYFAKSHHVGSDSDRPLFVVGMPRSGTTLVEQVIASHPEVAGAGELPNMPALTEDLTNRIPGDETYPQSVSAADPALFTELAQTYLARLTTLAPDARRVADKLPDNFLHIGLIATLFPNARIIHCRRDPLDVGLSCYMSDFGALRWAWRLEDIAFYYSQYARMMEHWQRVAPIEIFTVDYERLVEDHEAVSRALIGYCDLDWDERCLEFFKTDNVVKTLSRVQVRQPIYNTSIGRWKHYEKYLQPLLAVLNRSTDS